MFHVHFPGVVGAEGVDGGGRRGGGVLTLRMPVCGAVQPPSTTELRLTILYTA